MAGPKQRKTPIGMAKMLQNLSIVPPECCGETIKQGLFRQAPRMVSVFMNRVIRRRSGVYSESAAARQVFV